MMKIQWVFCLIVNFLSHDLEMKPEESKPAKVCAGLLQDGRKRRAIRFPPSEVPLSARLRRRRAKRLSCGATIISHYHLAATETEGKSRGGLESRPKAARSRSQRDLGDAGTPTAPSSFQTSLFWPWTGFVLTASIWRHVLGASDISHVSLLWLGARRRRREACVPSPLDMAARVRRRKKNFGLDG